MESVLMWFFLQSVLTAVIAAVFLLRHRKRPHGPLPILDTFGLPEADGMSDSPSQTIREGGNFGR